LPSIWFLYVHSSRGRRSIGSAMNLVMKIGQPILWSAFTLLLSDTVHSGCGLSRKRVKAFPQQFDCQMVEQGGELHLLIIVIVPCCFPHARRRQLATIAWSPPTPRSTSEQAEKQRRWSMPVG
jgi:hypothetical protein